MACTDDCMRPVCLQGPAEVSLQDVAFTEQADKQQHIRQTSKLHTTIAAAQIAATLLGCQAPTNARLPLAMHCCIDITNTHAALWAKTPAC